jgi:MATE family multidrug resistance protein
MGILVAADVLGLSFFQIIEVRAGLLDGAATQVAMMLTSVAYLPGLGLAQVGTTLVAQAIGAGQRAWAATVGTRLTVITAVFMGVTGIVLACAGPWLARRFMSPHDLLADATARLVAKLLWFAALYQFFDGLNLGSSFSLRGAGDVRVPALIVAVCSLGIFAPLSYVLTFAPGQGWFDALPELGFGAVGGWSALVLNVFLVGGGLWLRWRSRAWERLPYGAARAG